MLNTVTYYHKRFAFTIITGKYVYTPSAELCLNALPI